MAKIIAPNTPEWFAARRGLLTASRMADAMAVSKKDGKPLKGRTDLIVKLAAERLTGTAEDNYVNAAMQWGIDNEAGAADAYEVVTGRLVSEAGLVMHPTISGFGATPDRFVGTDGQLEIKCPNSTTHMLYLMNGVLPDEYAPQVYTQLACTGRAWCDFVSYDPRFQDEELRLLVVRVDRDEAKIKEVEDAARAVLAEVVALHNKLLTRKAA